MNEYHSRALRVSFLALTAFGCPVASVTDASAADGPTKYKVENAAYAPVSSRAAAAISSNTGDNTLPKSSYDRRFIERVRGLVSMGAGLQRACNVEKKSIVDTSTLISAIEEYLDQQIASRNDEIAQIEAKLNADAKVQKKEDKLDPQERAKLANEKQKLEGEIELYKEAKGNASGAAKTAADSIKSDNVGNVCIELCGRPETKTVKNVVNVCEFGDDVTATAAIIADPQAVEGLARYLIAQTTEIRKEVMTAEVSIIADKTKPPPKEPKKLNVKLGDLSIGPLRNSAPVLAAFAGAEQILEPTKSALSLDVAAQSMRTMDVALKAIATVIEDRAKREGLVWFLERMNDKVCKIEGRNDKASVEEKKARLEKNKAITEIRTYWLKHTCALAEKRTEYMQMGGGAKLLGAFRGAVASDLKTWPGAAAGLGAATMFLQTMFLQHEQLNKTDEERKKRVPNLLACHEENMPDAAICNAVTELRRATAKLTDDLIAGGNAGIALEEYGNAIHRLNVTGTSFYSEKFEMAACVATVPIVFQEYKEEVTELDLNRFDATEALLLGALTRSPACFAITGAGWKTSECTAFNPTAAQMAKTPCNPNVKLTSVIASENEERERLTTILRWSKHVHQPARDVVGRWAVLRSTGDIFEVAFADMKEHLNDPPPIPPPFNFAAVNDAKTIKAALAAAQEYAATTAQTFQQSRYVKFTQASLGLAHAGVDFGVSLTATGKSITKPELFPGFNGTSFPPQSENNIDYFSKGHDVLVKLSDQLGTIEASLAGDWGKVVPKVMAEIRADLATACGEDERCKQLASRLARYTGIFTALATDSDPDATAQALDAAAMPIGGWRRKLMPGSTVVSIASFPGFSFGGELRYGQYGATYERFDDRHWVSPTLTMPVGIDFASSNSGKGSWSPNCVPKIFVSLIDPAAYLQYDVEKDGRLPGAQLLSALSPGVSLRFAPFDAPLSVNIYGVFRPNFRAWESGLSVPAAHAIQAGLSLSIDVTLFELFASEPEIEVQ